MQRSLVLTVRHRAAACLLAGGFILSAGAQPTLNGCRIAAGTICAEAHLSGAHLRDADLARSNLARAMLDGADLRGANLRNANLRRAKLDGAVWTVPCSPMPTCTELT